MELDDRWLLRALLASTERQIAVLDRDLRFMRVNDAYVEGCGRTREQLIGRLYVELFSDPEIEELFRRVLRTGQPSCCRARPLMAPARPEHGVTYWDWELLPIRDQQGDVHGLVLVLSDVTERTRAVQKQFEADRRTNRFIATLGHELRAPLAPLVNATQILKRTQDRATVEESLAIIEQQVWHMVRLVDEMLDVSRVTLGKVELKQERVELAMVLESSLSTVAPRVEARGHRLSVQVPDEPLWLEGDPVRLAQVLTNLLDNAIKYTPEGGEITVDARHEGSQALLVIRDNGIGITTGCLSEVFEPLAQLDQPGSSGGLGLGLALARAITRLHGGDITAHSAGEGQGSTFCVRLPLSQREEDSTEHPEPAVVSDDEVRGLRVLVVDDNVDSANSLAMLLELLGHRPSVALDGESALSMARRQLPDAAILDVALPGMDGTQLAEKLRQLGGDRVLLVALTGLNPSAMEDSNGEGFDHRLTKPADVPQLQQLLGAHVQRMHES